MWRLWTRGWGLQAWWFWFHREGFPLWVASKLPPRITLWAFILVSAGDPVGPDDGYKRAYDAWATKHHLKGT